MFYKSRRIYKNITKKTTTTKKRSNKKRPIFQNYLKKPTTIKPKKKQQNSKKKNTHTFLKKKQHPSKKNEKNNTSYFCRKTPKPEIIFEGSEEKKTQKDISDDTLHTLYNFDAHAVTVSLCRTLSHHAGHFCHSPIPIKSIRIYQNHDKGARGTCY